MAKKEIRRPLKKVQASIDKELFDNTKSKLRKNRIKINEFISAAFAAYLENTQ